MKNNFAVIFCLCVFAVFCIFEKTAQACMALPPHIPWEIEFENGTIFYMTPESPYRDYPEERMQIRTGLYYNTEPPENIYYADINAYEWSVFFSDCGKYFATVQVTYENFDHEKLGGGVVNFFENGVLKKRYVDREVPVRLPIEWLRGADTFGHRNEVIETNLNENILTVESRNELTFVFDITTGEMISGPTYEEIERIRSQPRKRIRPLKEVIFIGAFYAFAIISATALAFLIRKRKIMKKG